MSLRVSLVAAALVASSLVGVSSRPAAANDTAAGAAIGGITGAIIGGAVTGRAGGALVGGAIGAGTGALIGSQSGKNRSGYYWRGGRCYYQQPNGRTYQVAPGYCR